MKYLFLLLITTTTLNVFSQTIDLKVKEKTVELKVSRTELLIDNITEIIKDENQNDIAVYSNYLGLKEIKEGQYKGQKTGDFKEGVAFKDGSKFEFSYKEKYLCNIGNYIYTEKIDFLNSVCQINVYQISSNNLKKLSKSITLPFSNTFDKIPNSQYLIFTNLDEGFGTEIKIYDKDLNIVNTIIPFNDSFSNIVYSSLGEDIFIVSSSNMHTNSNKRFKVSIINTKNNYSKTEVNYNDEIIPQSLIALENNFVLICAGKLMFFNPHGELLWTKNMNVSPSEYATLGYKPEDKLFVISEGAIVCLKITDGVEVWRKPLEDIYPSFEKSRKIENEYYMAYVTLDLKLIGSIKTICLLSAKKEHNLKDNTLGFSNKNLTMIDFSGTIVKQIPLTSTNNTSIDATNYSQGRVKPCHLIVENFGFKIVNDRKIDKYEK